MLPSNIHLQCTFWNSGGSVLLLLHRSLWEALSGLSFIKSSRDHNIAVTSSPVPGLMWLTHHRLYPRNLSQAFQIVVILIYSNLGLRLCRSFHEEPRLSLIASPTVGAVATFRHFRGAAFREWSSWLLFGRWRRISNAVAVVDEGPGSEHLPKEIGIFLKIIICVFVFKHGEIVGVARICDAAVVVQCIRNDPSVKMGKTYVSKFHVVVMSTSFVATRLEICRLHTVLAAFMCLQPHAYIGPPMFDIVPRLTCKVDVQIYD
nr:putative serine/threonine-protein kinase [Ipomoea batatas]